MRSITYRRNKMAKREMRAFDRLQDRLNEQSNRERRVAPTDAERRYLTALIADRVYFKRERRKEVKARLSRKPMRYIGRRPSLLRRIVTYVRIFLGF